LSRALGACHSDALERNYDDMSYLLLNSPFFPDVAPQFIGQLKISRNRRLTVIAMNNIVDAFRKDAGLPAGRASGQDDRGRGPFPASSSIIFQVVFFALSRNLPRVAIFSVLKF